MSGLIFEWLPEIVVPYNPHLSKNRANMIGRGKFYKPLPHVKAKEEIEWELARVWKKEKDVILNSDYNIEKIWLNIYLYKPRKNIDAINCLDAVADAVQNALGFNDSMFGVYRINWEIDKINPRLSISIGFEGNFRG